MKLLKSNRGMTLIELTVSMLLLMVFMGAATTVMGVVGSSVAENVRLDRGISIAQTVLQTVDANVRTAVQDNSLGTIRCRGEHREISGLQGDFLEYVSDEDGCTIVIGTSRDTDLVTSTKSDFSGGINQETVAGYLEKRYYVFTDPAAGTGDFQGKLFKDMESSTPFAYGVMKPLVPDFYMKNTIRTEFQLNPWAEDPDRAASVSVTVTVLDPSGIEITTQTRTVQLVNHPRLLADTQLTMADDA